MGGVWIGRSWPWAVTMRELSGKQPQATLGSNIGPTGWPRRRLATRANAPVTPQSLLAASWLQLAVGSNARKLPFPTTSTLPPSPQPSPSSSLPSIRRHPFVFPSTCRSTVTTTKSWPPSVDPPSSAYPVPATTAATICRSTTRTSTSRNSPNRTQRERTTTRSTPPLPPHQAPPYPSYPSQSYVPPYQCTECPRADRPAAIQKGQGRGRLSAHPFSTHYTSAHSFFIIGLRGRSRRR